MDDWFGEKTHVMQEIVYSVKRNSTSHDLSDIVENHVKLIPEHIEDRHRTEHF